MTNTSRVSKPKDGAVYSLFIEKLTRA